MWEMADVADNAGNYGLTAAAEAIMMQKDMMTEMPINVAVKNQNIHGSL